MIHLLDELADNVVPAYAGVILNYKGRNLLRNSCPRVCGGDPAKQVLKALRVQLSPRMRG